MVKKRIASVLLVLLLTLGVTLSGSFLCPGEAQGKEKTEELDKETGVEENAAVSFNMKELFKKLPAKCRWNLNFYGRKALMSVGDEIKTICAQLKTAGEEKEDVELNTLWAEAYYEYLQKELKDNSSKMKSTGFRLVYIDDDDVPELLIMEDDFHGAGVRVCTYYQNKVVEIGEFGSMGNMFYAERQGKISSGFTSFGEVYYDYYVLDCGKAETIGSFHAYPDLDYDDDSVTLYEIDGESVTEKRYREKLDEFERDNYESIGYGDAVFVDDMAQLKTALAQEIEALELKDRLTLQQTETMEAYETFLEEYAEDFLGKDDEVWEDYEEYEDGYRGAKFALIYLDHDEIPELVISEGWSLGHAPSVYTYADKEVVCIGCFGQYGEIGYVEKEGILISGYYRNLHGHYDAYQVEGTEKKKLLWIDEYWHWNSCENPKEGEGYSTYTVDKKEAAEEEYMAAYQVYEEYKEKEKEVTYGDCFLMLDGNIRGNLCQAMARLVFRESEENWEYLIYPGEYDEVKLVNRNLIAVKDESGNYGIINREKDAITDFEYFNVWGDESSILVMDHNKKISILDCEGNLISEETYDEAELFYEDLAAVQKDGKWGFIDREGKLIIDCQYDNVCGGFSNGLAAVEKEGIWRYINTDGEWVFDMLFENAHAFSGGLAAVMQNGVWGFINLDGKTVIEGQFAEAGDFREGLAAVCKEIDGVRQWGYIDQDGKVCIHFQPYDIVEGKIFMMRNFHNGYAIITDTFYCLIDKNGQCVLGKEDCFLTGGFDYSEEFGVIPAYDFVDEDMKMKKYGFVDLNGNTVIPFIFYNISDMQGDLAAVASEDNMRTNGIIAVKSGDGD